VLALHAGLLALLLMPHPLAPTRAPAPSIAWVPLAPMTRTETAPAPIAAPTLAPPPASIFAPPSITAPLAASPGTDPALAGLREYLSCWLPEENALWAEDRERCKRAIAALPTMPPAPNTPTPAEIQLEQRFARDLAVQNSPIAAPCFSGGGFNVLCVVGGVLNGFDFSLNSYVDIDRARERTHPVPLPRDGSLASRSQR